MNDTVRPGWFDRDVLACQDALTRYAMVLCRRRDRAEDLVQDTILQSLRKFHQFEPGTSIKAWLFTIMRNHFLSGRRKAGREVEDPDNIRAGSLSVPEGQTWAYDLKVIRRRMRHLNHVQRGAVQLICIEQQTYEYASEVLRVPVGTVKSAVSRARSFLETGVVEPEEIEAPRVGVDGDQIARLFRCGLTVSEIAAQMPGVARADIMRVVVERHLKVSR